MSKPISEWTYAELQAVAERGTSYNYVGMNLASEVLRLREAVNDAYLKRDREQIRANNAEAICGDAESDVGEWASRAERLATELATVREGWQTRELGHIADRLKAEEEAAYWKRSFEGQMEHTAEHARAYAKVRPVLEAALAWRDPEVEFSGAEVALCDAVDAYRSES